MVNVSSLRFNKLCLHPYRLEHHYCSEKYLKRVKNFLSYRGIK